MKKHLLLMVLTLLLVFAFSATAMASSQLIGIEIRTADDFADLAADDTSVFYDKLTVDGNTVTLTENITLEDEHYLEMLLDDDDSLIIDLKGNNIIGNCYFGGSYPYTGLLTIKSGTVTIKNSGGGLVGKIHNDEEWDEGDVVAIHDGKLILDNGLLEGHCGVSMTDGEFVMNGGEIDAYDNGVSMNGAGRFVMYDGKIYSVRRGVLMETDEENFVPDPTSNSLGGEFVMYDGLIEANWGVVMHAGGTFTMKNGKIDATVYYPDQPGLGVYLYNGGHFVMNGGTIDALYTGIYEEYKEEEPGNPGSKVIIRDAEDFLISSSGENGIWLDTGWLQIINSSGRVVSADPAIVCRGGIRYAGCTVTKGGQLALLLDEYASFSEDNGDTFSKEVVFAISSIAKGNQINFEEQGALPEPEGIPAYINGYPDGTFRAANPISRAEAAKMLAYVLNQIGTDGVATGFGDVPADAWYSPFVATVAKRAIIIGDTDGNFRPAGDITCAEFIAMACRLANKQPSDANVPYTGISAHWAKGYISAAYEAGWLDMLDAETIDFDQPISRGDAVQILNVASGRDKMKIKTTANDFSDVAQDSPLYDAVQRAASTMEGNAK